jgi:hypothetical protein
MKLSRNLVRTGAPLALFATAASAQFSLMFKVTEVSALSDGGGIRLESTVGAPGKAESNFLKSSVGMYSMTQMFKIAGNKSPVRVRPTAALLLNLDLMPGFVMVSVAPTVTGSLQLRPLIQKKGEREFVTTGNSARNVLIDVVNLDEHTFKITPKLPLLSGEYALTLMEEVAANDPRYGPAPVKPTDVRFRMYCFGVD